MIKINIDNKTVEVPDGATILDASEKAGVSIPTMCFLKGCDASTSCMVCVVKVNGSSSLVPACATKAADGMTVESDTEEVSAARRTALELLLSDHIGDCMGPCHVTCPAKMDIPLMIRQIAEQDLAGAIKTVKADIPLPAVLGRICPAPCEKACRRRQHDDAVSICLLKRYVADKDIASGKTYIPECEPDKNKSVAVIGSGACGLSAAYFLRRSGYDCTVYDENETPGGMLLSAVDKDVLNAEIDIIKKMGVKIESSVCVGKDIGVGKLLDKFDAVILATGTVDKELFDTSLPQIFIGSDDPKKRRTVIAVVAAGKESAYKTIDYLHEEGVSARPKPFNCRMGKLKDGEMDIFMKYSNDSPRFEVTGTNGFDDLQAIEESARCLHCDCRKPDCCKLRDFARQYNADMNTFKAERGDFEQDLTHEEIIFEQGKCIDCGLCVQIVDKENSSLGLAFTGRGFDVRVKVPFDRPLSEGMGPVYKKCVEACPTGALAYK